MKAPLVLLLLCCVASAQAQQPDTTIVLPREGQWERSEVAGHVLAVRLETPQSRVTAGATYRALRLRVAWQGASGTIRMRAVLPPELQPVTPSSLSPR